MLARVDQVVSFCRLTIEENFRHTGYVSFYTFCNLFAIWYGFCEEDLRQDRPSLCRPPLLQFRSSGLAGNDSRDPMLYRTSAPGSTFGKRKALGTYKVAEELPSSSLPKRAQCTTRKGCSPRLVAWRERPPVQAESKQMRAKIKRPRTREKLLPKKVKKEAAGCKRTW